MIEKKDKPYCISFEDYDYCNGWNDAVDAIGRCKNCVWSREPTKEDYAEIGRDVLAYKDSLVCDFCEDARWEDDFCSYFKKRDDKSEEKR